MFIRLALYSIFAAAPALVFAQSAGGVMNGGGMPQGEPPLPPAGYLCCNMRTDGSWISDINYQEAGKHIIALGTPVTPTGWGRFRINTEMNGERQSIGNDYSRDLSMDVFAKRYIVADNPKTKLTSYPEKIRNAITNAKLVPGMTREQVLMAVGYPVSSENPNIDGSLWRYWLDSFSEFQVQFDAKGRVKEITADPRIRHVVIAE